MIAFRAAVPLVLALGLTMALPAAPARADVSITPYTPDLFTGCVQGRDIGTITRSSNPMVLLGSVVYTGKVLNDDGTVGFGVVRVPMPLPIVTSDAGSSDISTCEHNFQTATDGSITFLGFAMNALRTDVYRASVKLIARQKLAPVSQNGANVQPWFSTAYQPLFRQALASAGAEVNDFFLFDNISIYLLQVERYRKSGGGFSSVIGATLGGSTYLRDDSFRGTKLIVTGDPVLLTRAMFKLAPPVGPGQMASAGSNPQRLTAGEAMEINQRLIEGMSR